jgi:hypothetical protein
MLLPYPVIAQAVHIKCVRFYYNIVHELKGTRMKTKRIWVGYIIKFLLPTFYRRSVRALWVAWQISYVYSFSVHTLLSTFRVTVATAHCISYPLSKFQQSGSQWWHVHSSFVVPPLPPQKKKNSRGVRSDKRGGRVIGPPLLIHFSGNLQFKKTGISLWKCGGTPSCWNSMSSGLSSSKIFLYLRRHFNNCESSTSGGKIWKLKWHELTW